MNNSIQFINEKWLWFSIVLAFILVLLFIWKEWKGSFNRNFYINSVVALIGLTALLFMFLGPTWTKEVQGKAVLLTQGFSQVRLDSLKKQDQFIKEINYVPGENLKERLVSINELVVLGHGVAVFDYWQLEETAVNYLKGELPSGIVRINYPSESRVGTELTIQGVYNRPTAGTKLCLQGSGGKVLDSVILKSDNRQGFSLNTIVKTEGKFVYQLVEMDSVNKVISTNPLPLVVEDIAVLKVLIVNQFPSFETKYLKNYLSEEGHELVVRSKITSGKYKFEYFNTIRQPIYRFTEKSLAFFDVLILDTETFMGLSRNTLESLEKSVKEEGLGVFVQPNRRLFRFKNSLVNFNSVSDGKEKLVPSDWSKNPIGKYPYRFNDESLKALLIGNYAKRIVIGKGTIGTSLLKNSYELVLKGESDTYKEIWSSILSQISKKAESAALFNTSNGFIFKDLPFEFSVQTQKQRPQLRHGSGYLIPLMKDATLHDKWQGTIYPQKKGWNSLNLKVDTATVVMNYYVMDTEQWKPLVGANTVVDNTRFFGKEEKKNLRRESYAAVSSFWYFLLFLSCMGYLWLVPKLWN
ncbi:hypothetical protein [Maribacter sp. R77961]|uniref:hypothetical protein n=1 Tax=Maribacter sp. R77961 TaxID=3093871 RepID=UPI0037CC953D